MEPPSKFPARSFLLNAALIAALLCAANTASVYAAIAVTGAGGLCSAAPNEINWTTATEVNTAGFNLYRSESPGGPFTKVNAELIGAARDPLSGGKYQFEDGNVVAGRTYYYQLEDVEFSGSTTRHGPISVTAQSALWVCDHPEISLGLALGAIVAIGAVLFSVRRGRRSRQGDANTHSVGNPG